ncbi:MAG TPA: hypothetical protein VHP58_03175 [Alphaproteobacteria bacterium]|nr:hypothetical protein [Alphaproteobacteria bacterium]
MRLSLISAFAICFLLSSPANAQPPPPPPGPDGAIAIQQQLLNGLVPSSVGENKAEQPPLFMNNRGQFVPLRASPSRHVPSWFGNTNGKVRQTCYWVVIKPLGQASETLTLACENDTATAYVFPSI